MGGKSPVDPNCDIYDPSLIAPKPPAKRDILKENLIPKLPISNKPIEKHPKIKKIMEINKNINKYKDELNIELPTLPT